MAKIDGIPKTRPFLTENLLLSTEGRVAFSELEGRIPITGNGPPEGVVLAPAGATYYDMDGDTGSIHYVKMQQAIGGDGTLGWKLA